MILEDIKKMKSINIIGNMPVLTPVPIPTKNMSWFKKQIKLLEPRKWKIAKNYTLRINDKCILIPLGFEMDFASIPRIFWPILDPTGPLLVASIIHDFGYMYEGLIVLHDDNSISFESMSKIEIDEIFGLITKKINEMTEFAWISEMAVKCFGFSAWDEHRKNNFDVTLDYSHLFFL